MNNYKPLPVSYIRKYPPCYYFIPYAIYNGDECVRNDCFVLWEANRTRAYQKAKKRLTEYCIDGDTFCIFVEAIEKELSPDDSDYDY